jgi:predicted transport protein
VCGTGDATEVLKGRPPATVALYRALEAWVRALGEVEIVARDRYALFRTRRIFSDLTVMRDALRLAIHLPDRVDDPRFFKVVADGHKVTHVTHVRLAQDIEGVRAYLRRAYEHSLR